MRISILCLIVGLSVVGCSSNAPPPPDHSPEAAKRLEAEIKEAQSKEGQSRRDKKGSTE